MSDSPPPSASVTFKNQQFSRLNAYRRERMLVDIYLVSGVRLRGRIKSFDQYSLILDVGQGETFLYHHAVSSIGPVQGKAVRRPSGDGPRAGYQPRHEGRSDSRGEGRPEGRGDQRSESRHEGRGDSYRHAPSAHGDDPPPMRRPLGAPKPATEVTVVRRISRKISLPPKDGSDPSKT